MRGGSSEQVTQLITFLSSFKNFCQKELSTFRTDGKIHFKIPDINLMKNYFSIRFQSIQLGYFHFSFQNETSPLTTVCPGRI